MDEDVGVDGAEGGVGAMGEAPGECREDLTFEVWTRMGRDGDIDIGAVEVVVPEAENVGFDRRR
ncbi:hypothetical protein ABIA39_006998 [Nocardia sp. GAS34]